MCAIDLARVRAHAVRRRGKRDEVGDGGRVEVRGGAAHGLLRCRRELVAVQTSRASLGLVAVDRHVTPTLHAGDEHGCRAAVVLGKCAVRPHVQGLHERSERRVFGRLHLVLREETGAIRVEEQRVGEVDVPLERARVHGRVVVDGRPALGDAHSGCRVYAIGERHGRPAGVADRAGVLAALRAGDRVDDQLVGIAEHRRVLAHEGGGIEAEAVERFGGRGHAVLLG